MHLMQKETMFAILDNSLNIVKKPHNIYKEDYIIIKIKREDEKNNFIIDDYCFDGISNICRNNHHTAAKKSL